MTLRLLIKYAMLIVYLYMFAVQTNDVKWQNLFLEPRFIHSLLKMKFLSAFFNNIHCTGLPVTGGGSDKFDILLIRQF